MISRTAAHKGGAEASFENPIDPIGFLLETFPRQVAVNMQRRIQLVNMSNASDGCDEAVICLILDR
jgi:hypothetical protein